MTFKGFGSLFAQLDAPGSFGPTWWPANFSARCLATQVPRAAPSKRGIDWSVYMYATKSYAWDVVNVPTRVMSPQSQFSGRTGTLIYKKLASA